MPGPGAGLVPAEAAAQAPSPERANWARTTHRRYYRWSRLSRLTMAGCFVFAVIFFVWLVPWFPSGLDTQDYTNEFSFTIYLLAGVLVMGGMALAFRAKARRSRDNLIVWSALYDETTGLRSRSYLYDRLSLECERVERSGEDFSLLVLQIRLAPASAGAPPTLSNTALEHVAALINGLTHPTDSVALLSGSELAVLAIGVPQAQRQALLERLRAPIAEELPRHLKRPANIEVLGGAATYGVEGQDPGALVQAARAAARPQRTHAA